MTQGVPVRIEQRRIVATVAHDFRELFSVRTVLRTIDRWVWLKLEYVHGLGFLMLSKIEIQAFSHYKKISVATEIDIGVMTVQSTWKILLG